VSASVNLPLHHKVQKFSSGTGSPGWSRKKGRKPVVVVVVGAVKLCSNKIRVLNSECVLTQVDLYNSGKNSCWFVCYLSK